MSTTCPHCKKGVLQPFKETNPFNLGRPTAICPECGFKWYRGTDGCMHGSQGELGFLSGRVTNEVYDKDGKLIHSYTMMS